MRIDCSNCGAHRDFRYSAENVYKIVSVKGWNSFGSALYCPKCSVTWSERNKDKKLAGIENTLRVIDRQYIHQSLPMLD